MSDPPRIAFFPDSYEEVNGAAMTCKRLTDYARRNGYPFLVIHAGHETREWTDGSVEYLQLKRSPVSFSLDEELAFDPFFQRHIRKIRRRLVDFKPDIIHITGLNDVSIMGSYLGWKLQIPLLGSWHTNLHEFAAQRLQGAMRFLPQKFSSGIAKFAEKRIRDGAVLYYKMPKVVLAPNQELVELLGKGTHRAAFLMGRGVDSEKFSPAKRTVDDNVIRLGFVGRLRPEKNVRLLIEIEKELLKLGKTGFSFLIVGEGNERAHLEEKMKHAEFTGFLEGEALSEAYANMDIFIFPSETDAFGNVAQEASASGVPSIVSDKGGPKYIINHGETGYVAKTNEDYVNFAIELMDDREKRLEMGRKGRELTVARSWDAIFAGVYDGYAETLRIARERKQISDDE
ncbi:MAG: glycosyltransferase [Acidobacteria bacterium]|nr:glycosyltransferase [Acidobacteriota bacterium]